MSKETNKATDFIVLVSTEPQGGIKKRPKQFFPSDNFYRDSSDDYITATTVTDGGHIHGRSLSSAGGDARAPPSLPLGRQRKMRRKPPLP